MAISSWAQEYDRLSLFFKGLHSLIAVPANELKHPTRCNWYHGNDIRCLLCHLLLVSINFPCLRTVTDWSGFPDLIGSIDAFKKNLHKLQMLLLIDAEPRHTSNGAWWIIRVDYAVVSKVGEKQTLKPSAVGTNMHSQINCDFWIIKYFKFLCIIFASHLAISLYGTYVRTYLTDF